MANPYIRAEDLSAWEGRIFLGGRLIDSSALLSIQVEKRVTIELLGFYLIVPTLLVWLFAAPSSAAFFIVPMLWVCLLGAIRERSHAYVLLLNIYQIGLFEVRGFQQEEAHRIHDYLDGLRGGGVPGPTPGQRGSQIAGSST